MPRIEAPTVAEHHARQRARILDSAAQLFAEKGVGAVSLADVASQAGLRRSSLYRYFASRDDLVVALFERELPDYLARCDAILSSGRAPLSRILAWADDQVSYAVDPAHALANQLLADTSLLSAESRAEIDTGHHRILQAVATTIGEHLTTSSQAELDVVVELVGAMVFRATRLAMERGATSALRRVLRQSLQATLEGPAVAAPGGRPGSDAGAPGATDAPLGIREHDP